MSTTLKRLSIDIADGYHSSEASSFVAQLDNLSERMLRDLDLSTDELAWQLAPGMNTIGMLLTHIAIVEVFWVRSGLEQKQDAEQHVEEVLGITMYGDGIPLDEQAAPPEFLRKDFTYIRSLLEKAREYTKKIALQIPQRAIEEDIEVEAFGGRYIVNGRWVFYHILEHQAGHYGQCLTLKNRYSR